MGVSTLCILHCLLFLAAEEEPAERKNTTMAVSHLSPKTPYHARSISLPTQSHPSTLKVEGQLERLTRASETTSTSSSSSSISHNLGCLKDLFDCVDDLLQLCQVQQAFVHDHQERSINNQVLDGSLRLLDVCGTIREVLSKTMDLVLVLQSSLRRRRGCESDLKKEVMAYLTSRRLVKKAIHKCREQVKRACPSPIEKGHNGNVVMMLKQVEAITLWVLESLLLFISGPSTQSKTRKWSLVSKLMRTKRVACYAMDKVDSSEVEKMDVALSTFASQSLCKDIDVIRVQQIQIQLKALEVALQGLQEGLESVFKSTIKSRVTLLNILSY